MSDSLAAMPLLVFATEESVGAEVRDVLRQSVDANVNVFQATDLTRAVDVVRDREPRAALVELTGDLASDQPRIEELLSVRPELSIIGVYGGDSVSASLGSAEMVGLVRCGVTDFLRRPIAADEINGLVARLVPTEQPRQPSRLGTCIAMISNKGGVGKSTMAVNLAVSLASKYPDDVLLIDASLQMGVCAPMLNLAPTTSLYDAFEQRQRLDSTLIRQLATPHESGLLLMAAPPDPIAAADIDEETIARVLNLARRTFRFVIVDTFPLFDQTIMSVLDIADRAYVILDNVVPTVLSAVNLLELLDNLKYPADRISIVVNRYNSIPGNPLLDDVARSLRTEVDHVVPYDKRMITAANIGRPCSMDLVKWSKLHRSLREFVAEVDRLAVQSGEMDS